MRFLDYFDKFLKNKRLYKENQAFWRMAIATWTDMAWDEIPSDAEGRPMLHIFFGLEKKSFQLHQLEKNTSVLPISASIQEVEIGETSYTELSISLLLTNDTYQKAGQLLQSFLNNTPHFDNLLAQSNAKYQVEW